MKVSPNIAQGRRRIVPPIGLARPEIRELEHGEYQRYKLRNVPEDESSPTYELSVPYFGTGTPEEWLKFRKNLEKVVVGQNVTTGPGRYTVARRLLEGDALASFDQGARLHGAESIPNFKRCLDDVTKHVFPKRALQTQKRYMRRFLRKPPTMKIREYVARVIEINDLLAKFPPAIPGQSATKLPDDEILDLLEFGLPNTWQRNMVLQDFDPLAGDTAAFVAFCERMEQVEATETTEKSNGQQKAASRSKSSKETAPKGNKKRRRNVANDSENNDQETPVCMLHGPGHSTDQCKVLKDQAKKLKANWSASKKKKAPQSQELNAIVSSAVEAALQGRIPRKRKAKEGEDMQMIDDFECLSLSESEATLGSDLEEEADSAPSGPKK